MEEEILKLKHEIIVLLRRVNDLEILIGDAACTNEELGKVMAESLLNSQKVKAEEGIRLLDSQLKRLEELDAPRSVIEQKVKQKKLVERSSAKLDRAKPKEYLKSWNKQHIEAQQEMLFEATTTGWDIPNAFKLVLEARGQ